MTRLRRLCYKVRVASDKEAATWLLNVLDLQAQGQGVFTGPPAPDGHERTRMFGGQLIGQALAAASFTVPEDQHPHSLHAYFVRPGQASRATDFEVANMRDGDSSCLRKVMAVQRDELVCEITASFSAPAVGREYQRTMPVVTSPEQLFLEAQERAAELKDAPPEQQRLVSWGPLQIMPVQPVEPAPLLRSWIRIAGTLPSDPNLHACALAYASDIGAVHPSLRAVGVNARDPDWQVASLDHAVWFHRPFRADEWLLFVMDCSSVSAGRGLSHGAVFSQSGALVASLTQEALLRARDPLAQR